MRGMVIAVVLVLAVAAGWVTWRLIEHFTAEKPVAAAPPPVPVTAAVATSRDVPAIVPALGTVQSIDTVNVTPRVNGRIDGIYFKQGDEVAEGQKLFLINPHPYEAALEQAQGQLAMTKRRWLRPRPISPATRRS